MKKLFNQKFLIRIGFIVLIMYFAYTIFSQQTTLLAYVREQNEYSKLIEEEKEHNQELLNTKQNINSKEYIEQIAREKLSMYYPNEHVYIDIDKEK